MWITKHSRHTNKSRRFGNKKIVLYGTWCPYQIPFGPLTSPALVSPKPPPACLTAAGHRHIPILPVNKNGGGVIILTNQLFTKATRPLTFIWNLKTRPLMNTATKDQMRKRVCGPKRKLQAKTTEK